MHTNFCITNAVVIFFFQKFSCIHFYMINLRISFLLETILFTTLSSSKFEKFQVILRTVWIPSTANRI